MCASYFPHLYVFHCCIQFVRHLKFEILNLCSFFILQSPSKWFAVAYKEAVCHACPYDEFDSRTSQNFYRFEGNGLGIFFGKNWGARKGI